MDGPAGLRAQYSPLIVYMTYFIGKCQLKPLNIWPGLGPYITITIAKFTIPITSLPSELPENTCFRRAKDLSLLIVNEADE